MNRQKLASFALEGRFAPVVLSFGKFWVGGRAGLLVSATRDKYSGHPWFGNWQHNPFMAWGIGFDARIARTVRVGIDGYLGLVPLTRQTSLDTVNADTPCTMLTTSLYLGFDLPQSKE